MLTLTSSAPAIRSGLQVTRALTAVPFASADVERLPDEEETEEWQPLVRLQHQMHVGGDA